MQASMEALGMTNDEEFSKTFTKVLNRRKTLCRWKFETKKDGTPVKWLWHYHNRAKKWLPYQGVDGFVIRRNRGRGR